MALLDLNMKRESVEMDLLDIKGLGPFLNRSEHDAVCRYMYTPIRDLFYFILFFYMYIFE